VSLWTTAGTLLGSLVHGWIGGQYGPAWPLILSGDVLAVMRGLLKLGAAALQGEYGQA